MGSLADREYFDARELGRSVFLDEVKAILGPDHVIEGNAGEASFSRVRPVTAAERDSLVFISAGRPDRERLARETTATLIVCDTGWEIPKDLLESKCFIRVSDPKLSFARIADALYSTRPDLGVHPSAFVSPEADVHPRSFIGPQSYVGRASIGEGAVLFGHCHINDGVRIGRNVRISPGCVIGTESFGHVRDSSGKWNRLPQLGGVVIGDDVELGANVYVARGALGDTVLEDGVMVDAFVYIAHNARIGTNTGIIGHSMICGSVRVGRDCYISGHVIVRDMLTVGDRATIGMGAVVTKDVPEGSTVVGSPARPQAEFMRLQQAIKRL